MSVYTRQTDADYYSHPANSGGQSGPLSDRFLPTHERRENRTGRQVCCKVCHVCGAGLTEVLDGELWCPYCERYR